MRFAHTLTAVAATLAASIIGAPTANADPAGPPVHPGIEIHIPHADTRILDKCTLGWVLPGPDGYLDGLTAGHCASVGDKVYDASDRYLGTVTASSRVPDIAVIHFEGLPDGSLTTWVPYDGAMRPVLGQLTASDMEAARPVLCMIGKRTGQACGALEGTVSDTSLSSTLVSQNGDSGGPVYVPGRDGVYAVGIESTGSDSGSGVATIGATAATHQLTVKSPTAQ